MAIEVGDVLEGRVTRVKPFGAFVALPEGKMGMVHISEVSNEFVEDLSMLLREGQEVRVKVIAVSPDGRIALSIKRLLPPPMRPPRGNGIRPQGAPHRNGAEGRSSMRDGSWEDKRPPRPARGDSPRVWQPPRAAAEPQNFEDMMTRFKSLSEEKMADLDRETNNRRGGGYAPRGRRGGNR